MGVYKFKSRRSKKIVLKPREQINYDKPDEDVIQPIQGIMPDSKEEYWVAVGLYRLHLDFEYQYSIAGGSILRGGQIIDFLVNTVPLPTPVLVQGEYWHGGTKNAESEFKVTFIKKYFSGEAQDPVEIWDYEIPNMQSAYEVLKRKLL